MAANAFNRETCRDQITSLLSTALVDANIAKAVYSGKIADFDQQSPVVIVTSGFSDRSRQEVMGGSKMWNYFGFRVFSFVSYDLGDQEAEDRLDLIEKEIADTVKDNEYLASYWDKLSFDGQTDARTDVKIGGIPYRREVIDLLVKVKDV